MPRDRFALTLEALAGDAPVFARLKALLKAALRRWRFRCLRCVYADGRSVTFGETTVPEQQQTDRIDEQIRRQLARITELAADCHAGLPESLASTLRQAQVIVALDEVGNRLALVSLALSGLEDEPVGGE